jgi:hypothetical protein
MGDAWLILKIIEEAGYEYENIDKVIQEEIAESQNFIKQIQEMSETEFLSMVSKSLFGVASKGYYINKHKQHIQQLEQAKKSIDYLLEQYNRNPSWFEWIIKNSYRGNVKPMKEAIKKLAQTKFNNKLTAYTQAKP